jgi:anti-sigma factor ChrR (cupin superfamily)
MPLKVYCPPVCRQLCRRINAKKLRSLEAQQAAVFPRLNHDARYRYIALASPQISIERKTRAPNSVQRTVSRLDFGLSDGPQCHSPVDSPTGDSVCAS